jgi:hypothetical protein
MGTALRPLDNGWLPDTPVEDSVLRRFVFNQAQLNELVAKHAAGRVDRTAGVSLADARSPVAYLNQAVLLQPLLDADDPTVEVIENFTDASAHSSTLLSLWPTPDLQPRGWDLVGHPMLVLRSPGPTPIVDTHGVQVEFARSAGELAAAAQVAIDGYPFGEAGLEAGDLFPAEAVRHGLTVRVALVDDEPSAVGNSLVANGVVNLCLAATLPTARRRGAWRRLVWERVAEAPDIPAIAFTSDDSREGFERMGFLPITRLTLWSRSSGSQSLRLGSQKSRILDDRTPR